MTLEETLRDVSRQVLEEGRSEVEIAGEHFRVGRTRSAGLRVVTVQVAGRSIDGIEQNPNTRSRWAKMAQEGKRIMQFSTGGRYVANVCEGKVTRYPSWKALGLPE
jgi:hypothetical protein